MNFMQLDSASAEIEATKINEFQAIEQYNRYLLDWISDHVSRESIIEWDLHDKSKHSFSDLPEKWKLREDLYKLLLEV